MSNQRLVEGRGDEPIIIARDVHKWFGHFHALRGIDMEVHRGEKIVIFGPSGSGKSTFIRTINRLEEHQRGQIIVDGIELTRDVKNIAAIRAEIGMVFQSFNLFPHLTVLRNVTLAPMQVRGWSREKAENTAMQLLERVGITDSMVIIGALDKLEFWKPEDWNQFMQEADPALEEVAERFDL